jgi:hypothetical protein
MFDFRNTIQGDTVEQKQAAHQFEAPSNIRNEE